jgi:hypothetical protein
MYVREYFDEWKDECDYSISYRKVVYHGKLLIPFRKHLANSLATCFRREKIKHFLT